MTQSDQHNHHVDDEDDLDAYIADRDQREPGFAALVEEKRRLGQAADAHGETADVGAGGEETVEESATPNARP